MGLPSARERSVVPFGSSLVGISLVLLLAVVFWLPRVIFDPLRHWDEAWYAEMSRNLYLSDDPFTIYWNGDLWFHKPPLYFWMSALSFHCLGVSEASARLFSFLCGLGTLALVTGWSTRRWGSLLGTAAGMLLLAWPDFGRYAIRGQMDVPVAFFLSCQLLTYQLGLANARWHLLGGVFLGLNLMTKGVAGGLAYVIEFASMVVSGEWRALRQPAWWGAIVIGLLIAIPWHVQQWQQHGDLFLRDYLDRHFTQFFADIYPESNAPGAPVSYYLDYLLRKRAVWGWPLVAVGLASTLVLPRRRRDSMYVLCWCWLMVIPALLSLAWAKWSWYLVPIYPAASLLTVELLAGRVTGLAGRQVVLAGSVVLACASGIALTVLPGWTEHESEIREIGPVIARIVPAESRVLTLQTGSGRRSIYPVSTCFYGRRKVQAVLGVADLSERATNAGTALFALLHESYLKEVEEAGTGLSGGTKRYEMEEIARVKDVVFVRLLPGKVAEMLRQEDRGR